MLRTFFKRFRWGNFFPAVLLLLSGLSALCAARDGVGFAVSVGIFFVLYGAAESCAFFLGRTENPAHLLSGIAAISCALWLFITLNNSMYVSGIAIAVISLLRAGGQIVSAFREKEGRAYQAVRIALACLYLGMAAVLPFDPFEGYGILYFAGALLLFMGSAETVLCCLLGLFEEEETLVFRKAKK